MSKIASGVPGIIRKKKSFKKQRVISCRPLTVMKYRKKITRPPRAMTLVEITLAMAIMAIIFAALLSQFRVIQNSWDSQVGAAETLLNSRFLIDHLNRNLSKALRITAVSSSSETNGYIEFIDNDANNVRYDVNSTSDYVEFGLIGSPSDLAGPVSQLQFTCYGTKDLSTPIMDFEPTSLIASAEPLLCQIDAVHYLCAYSGVDSNGFAGVLELGTGEGILP